MDTKLIRHGFRQLLANKVRLGLTSFAIIISVGFVSASFTLGSGMSKVIFGWGETQAGSLDLVVEPEAPFAPKNFEVSPARVDDETLDLVGSVDGVSDARPVLWSNFLFRPAEPNGDLVDDKFTVTTYGWVDGSNFAIDEGAAPQTGEFTLDSETAETYGYEIGESYDMATPTETKTLRLAGTTRYREEGGTAVGQVVQTISLDELQAELGQSGYVNIHVDVEEGADAEQVKASLEQTLPDDLVVLTQDELKASLRELVAPFAQGISGGLIGFGVLSLFVACFIIYNTFSVLMQQRTRELGLLRAVGASPRQVRTSIQVEAITLGLVCSIVGIAAGLGISYGLSEWFHASGGLPRPDLALTPVTVGLSLVVGTGATLAAVTAPARKACRVPVIAAVRDGQAAKQNTSMVRFIIGSLLAIAGVIAITMGLFADITVQSTMAFLGAGAMATFIGVALLNSLWVAQCARILAAPLVKFTGVAGRLARDNIGRNRSRSASTAASLMIGLALVSLVLVVGESFKVTLAEGTDAAYKSDNIVVNQWGYKYPIAVADKLRALPEVDQAVAISTDLAEIDGEVQYLTIAEQKTAGELVDFDVIEGVGYSDQVANPVVVTEAEATEKGIDIGDELTTQFFNGEVTELTVVGINRNNTAGGNSYYIDRSTWFEQTNQTTADIVAVQSADSTTSVQFDAAMERFEATNEQVNVETIEEFVESTERSINSALQTINALTFLAILISFLGITNTLALSISERTKEMGLLRAVGMRRRPLRRALRYEALLISLFGSLIGVGLGIAFGIGSVAAIPETIADSVQVPVVQIVALVVVAALASVLASAVPAWRAAKRPPLELIRG